jgi:drug/metabolite transporter (DMT)-like permease
MLPSLPAQFIGTMLLFKWGWDVSVLIPIMGLCYVGTAIMGKWMLSEPVNATRWFGIVLIIVGVIFVARSVTQPTVPLFNRGMAHPCVRDSVHKP